MESYKCSPGFARVKSLTIRVATVKKLIGSKKPRKIRGLGARNLSDKDLALNADNVFQDDDCDVFDFDVDEAPMVQTMFMANLSSADPVNDEAGPSNVSSVLNDAYMMIYNDMYEPHAQSVSKTSLNIVVENSLTAELATYKEQVELYKRRARLKPYYNELKKVTIGYKNPLCLTRAKQVHHTLYNGHEFIKDNHVPAIMHNIEDTLEIVEITRMKMNDKMKDPECVTHKVKIAPHDYSKENFLATFTPHKQLTLEQIFWSQDLIKNKSEALREKTTVSRPIKALTMGDRAMDVTTPDRAVMAQ
nr:hypothetical protein [Tanacetum cinerariifolium]